MNSISLKDYGEVYGLRLKGSDKIRYVGITSKTSKDRFRRHVERAKNQTRSHPVYNWMASKGVDNIEFVVLEVCPKAKLNQREVHWIKRLRTFIGEDNDGLNCTLGGDGNLGHKWTPEQIRKNRGKRIGLRASLSSEQAENIRQLYATTGMTMDELALMFNVSSGVVFSILHNITHHDPKYVVRTIDRVRGGNLRLSRDEVKQIRDTYTDSNLSYKEIAKRLNLTSATVGYILTNRTYYDPNYTPRARRKLTESQVQQIKRLRQEHNRSTSDLAKQFSVSETMIRNIVRGDSWAHVRV